MTKIQHILIAIVLATPFFVSCSAGIRETSQYKQYATEAKAHYDAERYPQAIACMQDLSQYVAQHSQSSAAEMHNLASAYYRSGELGMAILYYERAHRIEPHNQAIAHSLKIARGKTVDKLEANSSLPEVFWHKVAYSVSTKVAIGIAYLLVSLLAFAIVLYLLSKRRRYRQVGFYTFFIALVLFVLDLAVLAQHRRDFFDTSERIVTAALAYVKSEPKDEAQTLFQIHEGTKIVVRQKNNTNAWLLIELADGKQGWLPTEESKAIYPFTNIEE